MKKKSAVVKADGQNTALSFESTTHEQAGCKANCDGDHVRVIVSGIREGLETIPRDDWTTAEILAVSAAEYISGKLTLKKAAPKGLLN